MQASIDTVERNVKMMNVWLKETSQELGGIDEDDAWRRLRAVLQTIRDRVTIDEAAHFAAQLPILARGLFYEDWRPSESPQKWRDRGEYLEAINAKISNDGAADPEETLRAVLKVIERHIDAGEVEKVKEMHPKEMWDLWPS
ncbi:DUF2267 domain-containing protein [Marinobacter fonticola]|uniref:DUF2267 domain-containing protein n=1 Tax=Marinobacter fonticola TaxID=2603215 RepID=UPI0011E62139|nr:DUF2267 domain-containing protein [Marinobacter fonticola]